MNKMERRQKIEVMKTAVRSQLLQRRRKDGMWSGFLSDSAVSTSVSLFALNMVDASQYAVQIMHSRRWLCENMKPDGSWGDSEESPSNRTATLLAYASLTGTGGVPDAAVRYIREVLGWDNEQKMIQGILDYYGKDLTFSVPILMMCALCGVIRDWSRIPLLPFELAVLPQRFFRFLNLPVVSYAIPALIAVGVLQNHMRPGLMARLRRPFVEPALRVLARLQPEDGGFLEAAPLTAFVAMCLTGAGLREHPVTQACIRFLVGTVRDNGAWPIDTDLSGWVTSLSARALSAGLSDAERQALSDVIRRNATRSRHPFTGAPAGGWGWSDRTGSVPDGDDTSGALVALYHLLGGRYVPEVGTGINWLMQLQNRDGGMPTFCKGWGKLPFDRSTPDITAHAILAMALWLPSLSGSLKQNCEKSLSRLFDWLEKEQEKQGSWNPLWFGDQDSPDGSNRVYGVATLIDYLCSSGHPRADRLAERSVGFLLAAQNEDGGWGGERNVPSKVTLSAKALSALSFYPSASEKHIARGIDYLYRHYEAGTLCRREPVGLYFSKLWYSEDLYNLTFILTALERL